MSNTANSKILSCHCCVGCWRNCVS